MRDKLMSFLSLFTSVGTLLCCALPALLVTLGLGAVVVAGVSAFPWLVPLTRNKEWLFLSAGVLIVLNFFLVYRWKPQTVCDLESGGDGCHVAGGWNRVVLRLSAGIYGIGLFMAYAALPLMEAFD